VPVFRSAKNLQTVATAAEEMGISIKDIAKNATEAAKVASAAVSGAQTANTTVSKLGESSAEIGRSSRSSLSDADNC